MDQALLTLQIQQYASGFVSPEAVVSWIQVQAQGGKAPRGYEYLAGFRKSSETTATDSEIAQAAEALAFS